MFRLARCWWYAVDFLMFMLPRRWWYTVGFVMFMFTRCWWSAVSFLIFMLTHFWMLLMVRSWLSYVYVNTLVADASPEFPWAQYMQKRWKMIRSFLEPGGIESQVSHRFWIPFGCTERNAPLALSECHLVTPSKLHAFSGSARWKSFLQFLWDKFLKKHARVKIDKSTKNRTF